MASNYRRTCYSIGNRQTSSQVAGTFFNMMGPEILETAQAAKPASEPTGQQEAVALEEATQSEASHGLSVDSKTEL